MSPKDRLMSGEIVIGIVLKTTRRPPYLYKVQLEDGFEVKIDTAVMPLHFMRGNPKNIRLETPGDITSVRFAPGP